MNFRKIYCIAAMALMCCTGSMFTSCDDYLDVDSYFDEIFELDSVFKRKESGRIYQWCRKVIT